MTWIVRQVREASWLHAARARAWCVVLAMMSGLTVLAYLVTSHGGIDRFGKPLGTDFISFWTAARLALSGHPASAYLPQAHAAAERALFPRTTPAYAAFFYPPSFLLLCLPLGVLPYMGALALWSAAGLLCVVLCLRRILPPRWAILPMLAFPGMLINLGNGQNGFVTASCFGWSMVLRRHHPLLAGMCLGLLVIKPHLLLAAPVALLAGRQWRMLAGALASSLGMIVSSWLVFGHASWEGFFRLSRLARATLEQGLVAPWKMQSIFAAVRLADGGIRLAYGLQGVAAAAALWLLARAVWRRPAPEAEGALLVLATMLCTPFLLDYDFVSLALPIAWIAGQAQRRGWMGWEKLVLLAAYLLPLVMRTLALGTGVSAAPLVVAAMFVVTLRRAACSAGDGLTAPSRPSGNCHAC